MNSSHARTLLPERNLDILRSVAVLLVLADHALVFVGLGKGWAPWLGGAGVQAFFVHTSLVLMASLERDGAPARKAWVWRFYVRRAFRIYPLACVVIAIVLLLHLPPAGAKSTYEWISRSTALANFALVQNLANRPSVLAVLWTLPLELQMYAALPFCYLVARRNSREWLLALVALSIAVAAVYAWGIEPAHRVPGMNRLNVLRYVPSFLMGVFAYSTLRRRSGSSWALPAWTWLPIILITLAVYLLTRTVSDGWWPVQVAFCAVLAFAIPKVRDAGNSAFARGAHVLATYSYGVYLFHLPALHVGFTMLPGKPMALQVTVATAVLAACCFVGHHAIEKPGIALGQRILGLKGKVAPLESTAPAP
jgi:peptidoglycan/LPS O-acetylase OafA/YrhL